MDWEKVAAVILTGGADIDPVFYGRTAESGTYINSHHDALDTAVLDAVRGKNIKKFGTCRGAQRLWADEGGELVQHIPHHGRDHMATVVARSRAPDVVRQLEAEGIAVTREAITERRVEVEENAGAAHDFQITSLHHQACIWESWESRRASPPPQLLLVGESRGQSAVEAWANPHVWDYGFQYHPEWMNAATPGYQWTIGAIQSAMGVDVTVNYTYPRLHKPRWRFPHEQS
jgi:gamma-glutamyl-gamma-aminobutyrate hydrolase PuuD